MAIAKRTRQQIEKHIATCAASIQKNGLEIGRDLIEIRDDELWADEYESWNQYLKERAAELVGRSAESAVKMIRGAEIAKRLPTRIDDDSSLATSHLMEIGRLAPNSAKHDGRGVNKDYSKLRKQDVARVIKSAIALAGGESPSVRDLREAVDTELGIDRKAEAAKAKAKRERDSQIDLADYLSRVKGTSEGWLEVLQAVPAEAWEDYASELDEAATALESLAEFLRS